MQEMPTDLSISQSNSEAIIVISAYPLPNDSDAKRKLEKTEKNLKEISRKCLTEVISRSCLMNVFAYLKADSGTNQPNCLTVFNSSKNYES